MPTTFTSLSVKPYNGEWVFLNFLLLRSIRENAWWYKISTELPLSMRIFFTVFVPTFSVMTSASWWPSIILGEKSSSEKKDYGRRVWARSIWYVVIDVEYFSGVRLPWIVRKASGSVASENDVYDSIVVTKLFLSSLRFSFCKVDKMSFSKLGLQSNCLTGSIAMFCDPCLHCSHNIGNLMAYPVSSASGVENRAQFSTLQE